MNDRRPASSRRRKRDLHLPIVLTLTDLLGVVLGLGLAYWIRFHSAWLPVEEGSYVPFEYQRALPLAALIWLLSFALAHLYHRHERVWSWRVARRVFKGSLLALGLLALTFFFARALWIHGIARWVVLIAFFSVQAFVLALRFALHRKLVWTARAVVIGVGPSAREIARTVRRRPEYGWEVIGFVSSHPSDVGRRQAGVAVLGTIEDLPQILERENVEAVFVAKPDFRRESLGDVFFECQRRMVDVKVLPDLTEMLFTSVGVEEVDGMPFLGMRETPLRGWSCVVKRGFDVAVSLLFLIPLAPLLALIALAVKRDSKGPVFYRQERVGADGRRFRITKFRTMCVNAEAATGPVFSGPDDPRQTRVGRWLRQLHLDELPQLLNVLKGDMSIVGPRPERPYFVERFSEKIPRYMTRHRVKSGLTGWAQVNGQTGHEGTIEERLRYDLFYIERWSLLFDLKVLLLTGVWLLRRLRQMRTLPADHPALRRTHDPMPGVLSPASEHDGEADAAAPPRRDAGGAARTSAAHHPPRRP